MTVLHLKFKVDFFIDLEKKNKKKKCLFILLFIYIPKYPKFPS